MILPAPVDAAHREATPPLIADLEEAILYVLLSEGQIRDGIRQQLSPEMFSERWRPIARAILCIADRFDVCDIVAVGEELERIGYGGIAMSRQLAHLAEFMGDREKLEIYIRMLRERAETGDLHDDSPLARSGLSRLRAGDDLKVIEDALRHLAGFLKGADPLAVAVERERASRKLREIGVQSPGRLLDAALPSSSRGGTDETQQGRPIVLQDPDPWREPVDGAELLDEIAATVRRYVIVPREANTASALWVVHTHAMDEAQMSPILGITSPVKRCGKTRFLDVIALLVRRPLPAASITPAAIYRTIEAYSPTLLIDEGDSFLEKRDELRGILNSGHTRTGAFVVRSVGDEHKPHNFSTWCPKAIALIGKLHPTLQDRAIVISMRRRARGEHHERLRVDRIGAATQILRQKIARWVADHREALRDADPDVPDVLNDRAGDNWRPLLAIADAAGGPWPAAAREAARILSGEADEADDHAGLQLLADLADLFHRRAVDRLPTAEIIEHLLTLEERGWGEFNRGKPVTPRQVGRLLRPFGITSRNIRTGENVAKGYVASDLEDALSRYIRPLSATALQPAPDGGEVPIGDTVEPTSVADEEPGLTAGKHSSVADVADRNLESVETALPVGLPSPKDLDLLEVEFRSVWRATPRQNRLIAVDTWPDGVELFCRERGLGETVFAALEPRVRDLRESGRRRGRRDGRGKLGAPLPLFG